VTGTKRFAGMSEKSSSRKLGTGSSSVLLAGSSFRALVRIQPPWTKVSLPSGRISLIVAGKSTLGVDERNHRSTRPAPTTAVSELSGGVTYATALPGGSCVHW
jgi:hypothetical protein